MIIDIHDFSSDVDQRKKYKDKMDGDFEQFLKSIDNFKFHHMGRITSNLDDGMHVILYSMLQYF